MMNGLAGFLRFHEMQIQLHRRITAGKTAQRRRQVVQADVVTGGDAQFPSHLFGQVAQNTAAVLQFQQDAPGAGQQGAAALGELDLLADAVEQRQIQFRLQRRHPLAHRRLGQMQPSRRAGKGAGFGHGKKGAQAGDVHKIIPLWNDKYKNNEFA